MLFLNLQSPYILMQSSVEISDFAVLLLVVCICPMFFNSMYLSSVLLLACVISIAVFYICKHALY